MTRGVLLTAHDNGLIQYGKLAEICAALVRKHMGPIEVALVTDSSTQCDHSQFEHVVINDPDQFPAFKNTRRFVKEVRQYPEFVEAPYLNHTRPWVYMDSPFEETLVLDTDFLVLDDSLNGVWDGPDFQMNRNIVNLSWPSEVQTRRLHDVSVHQYWATVFFFRKTAVNEQFFEVVRDVQTSYDFYSVLYKYTTRMYRNDTAFSMAVHLMGHKLADNFGAPLPVPWLLTAWEQDKVLDADPRQGVLMKVRRQPTNVTFPARVNQSFHCMHKLSFQEHAEKLL